MGASTCVACGECVQACPTGALAPAHDAYVVATDRTVESVCPYCGVGCQLTYHVKDNAIVRVAGRDGPANHDRLCVKGRFGFDYVSHPQRLTKPLIRKPGFPKTGEFVVDPANPLAVFREASWDEALDLAGGALARIRDAHGPRALAGFGSAKCSNEEAYLFQKLVRTGFGSNNVDHCTRLCHASSVAALLEGIGSGAVSNPVMDVMQAEVVLLIGANPVVNHPVAATWIKNAVKRGTHLILADPRRSELARHAKHYLQFKADTDVALLNAMMFTIIEEGLVAQSFVNDRTSGFAELAKNVAGHSPEAMAPVCGIPADTIRAVARLFASSRASMILWGMGISQHSHGTDNARCLIALSMLTGQVGRPGTGLHPLRGQNNVQGASDVGLIPMMYPDYRRVDNADAQRTFEALWGMSLDPNAGLTVVEIMHAAKAGQIRGMYVMGENPAMSDPDVHHAREALASLEMLVVQDIFVTETCYLADVILPATAFPEKTGTFTNTDRTVQLGRQALAPPGDARQDLEIVVAMAKRLGLDWSYAHPRDVFAEMRKAMPSIAGITWERLEREHAVTYPCEHEGDPGERVVFTHEFPTATGRARLVPAQVTLRRRAARRRVSVRSHHRAAARALAHRKHDPAHRSARRDRAGPGRLDASAGPRRSGRGRGWDPHGRVTARHDHAECAGGRRHAARRGIHSVLLLRGGGEPPHQSGARPVREDSGIQVLRSERDGRRRASRRDGLRLRERPDHCLRWRRARPVAGG